MIQKIARVIAGTLLVVSVVLGVSFLAVQDAGATPSQQAACRGSGGEWVGGKCVSSDGRTVTGTLQRVANILIFIVGAMSVIMVIVGGVRYSLSQGDQSAITSAKNTILYAIIGIVISFAAFGIVNFVNTQFN